MADVGELEAADLEKVDPLAVTLEPDYRGAPGKLLERDIVQQRTVRLSQETMLRCLVHPRGPHAYARRYA